MSPCRQRLRPHSRTSWKWMLLTMLVSHQIRLLPNFESATTNANFQVKLAQHLKNISTMLEVSQRSAKTLSDVASEAIADLLELESPPCPTLTPDPEDQDDLIEIPRAQWFHKTTKTLTDLPLEVQKIICGHIFSRREIIFSGCGDSELSFRAPTHAWSMSLLRVNKTLFTIASEALREAMSESTLTYNGCLPRYPYNGRDHMHAKLGKDDSILKQFLHETFLDRCGLYFRDVHIISLHQNREPNLEPFSRLERLTVGVLIWEEYPNYCNKAKSEPLRDYLAARYRRQHTWWSGSAHRDLPFYFCKLIIDDKRGFKMRLKARYRSLQRGEWDIAIDVDEKKVVELTQVGGTLDQALNSL